MKRDISDLYPGMADPHVVSLTYRIEKAETVDFDKAPPRSVECKAFRTTLDAYKAKAEMLEHFRFVEQAREVVDPFLRTWELSADVTNPDDRSRFVYESPEIIDRDPTGKRRLLIIPITVNIVAGPVPHVSRDEWPEPPRISKYRPMLTCCGAGGVGPGKGKSLCYPPPTGH